MKKSAAHFQEEKRFWKSGLEFIAGVDEVGRGSWAGPVVAGAVVFPQGVHFPEKLYDSKLVLPRQRENLAKLIYKYALSVGLGVVEVPIINKSGVGRATQKAFRAAIKNLLVDPDHILIDAFYIKHLNKDNQLPIKNGDQICASIAAASIIAKVYRDSIMRKLSRKFPVYKFAVNKGYGTRFHQEAIRMHDLSSIHRKSFNLSYLTQ